MLLFDVNVPIAAFAVAVSKHREMAAWLTDLVNGREPFAVNESVLSSFVRVVTVSTFPGGPASTSAALEFASAIRHAPGAVRTQPGPAHWDIFRGLCAAPGVRGNLIPDAYLAALAIEQDLELVTTDSDFARFPGLRWRHPLRPDRGLL